MQSPRAELAYTRVICPGCHHGPDECECSALAAPYGVKLIHESNPGDPYSWVAEIFMRQHQTEKLMSAADFGLRWLGQIISPIYLYVAGMIAAFLIASAGAAGAYTPVVCHADAWGALVCHPMYINPSAKIIHVEPFERETAAPVRPAPVRVAPPVEIEPVPLPRPRPKNLGEPQADRTLAPIDRSRQVIQQ